MKQILVLGSLCFIAACSPADSGSNSSTAQMTTENKAQSSFPVVATVNGEAIHQDVMDYFGEARYRGAEVTAEQSATMLGEITQLYAMAAAAREMGLDVENQVAMKINLQEKSMLAQLLVQKYTAENPVTEESAKASYESGAGGQEYRARHILVTDEATAKDLIGQLDGGADFAALAKEHSTGPSAEKGGLLGDWFPATQMVKPFADALAGIPPGTYSPAPVNTQFGWHVIKVEETRQLPFDQAKAKIMESMRNEQIKEYIASIKNGAQIELK